MGQYADHQTVVPVIVEFVGYFCQNIHELVLVQVVSFNNLKTAG